MTDFYINQQTDALQDDYLLECFQDNGVINKLITEPYSIVAGRTGSGKTAIANYVEAKGEDFGIDIGHRISIRQISLNKDQDLGTRSNDMLFFIMVKTIQKLLSENVFSKESSIQHWQNFLIQNNLQNVEDYKTFIETRRSKKHGFSVGANLKTWVASAKGSHQQNNNSVSDRSIISNSPSHLYAKLSDTLPDDQLIYIFVDDITDYLEHSNPEELENDLLTIEELLTSLSEYNTELKKNNKKLRFISLFRNDLFEAMKGSSVNKLRSDSLTLEWSEKNFASLLIRRLPFFQNDIEAALSDPINSIKQQFPDSIFSDQLNNFETNRYSTNFYAYMVAISFNRPRDFLSYCYALKDRLSLKKPVMFKNLESAEIEYSNYFQQEVRDELYLTSRILGFEANNDQINKLINILNKDSGFSFSELRTQLSQFTNEKSPGKKKIEFLVEELFRYGIIGVKEKPDKIIRFNYIPNNNFSFSIDDIKKYVFFLHRGLWWFAKKREKK